MKTTKCFLTLFVVLVMTAACSREEYHPVTLGRISPSDGQIRVSGIPTQNLLGDNWGRGKGQLKLTIENDQKDNNGRSTEWLDADTYTVGPNKEQVVIEAHKLIDEAVKQKRPIELYGKYHFQAPVDNRSGAFIVLILHKVKVADQFFAFQ